MGTNEAAQGQSQGQRTETPLDSMPCKGAQDLESDAPTPSAASDPTGRRTAASCSRCGYVGEPADKGRCPECGSFMKGNEAALKHGARRFEVGAGTPLDEAVVVQLRDSVLADAGGQDAVSAIQAELIYDFARACCLRDLAWQHIAAVGPFTKSGKRRAVVSLWMEASARVERLGKMIGLERRAAPVPDLGEYLKEREAGSRR